MIAVKILFVFFAKPKLSCVNKKKIKEGKVYEGEIKNKKIVTKSMTVGAFNQRIRPHFIILILQKIVF
jgi:hypothetical protein